MLQKISLNAKETLFPYCYHQSLPCEPVLRHNSFRYSSLFITFIASNQRWRQGETRWCLWCSLGSLPKIPPSYTSVTELCVTDLMEISYYSPIRCSDMGTKYHLELHSCRRGCCFPVVFSWAQRCRSLWQISHQIQAGSFVPVFSSSFLQK